MPFMTPWHAPDKIFLNCSLESFAEQEGAVLDLELRIELDDVALERVHWTLFGLNTCSDGIHNLPNKIVV